MQNVSLHLAQSCFQACSQSYRELQTHVQSDEFLQNCLSQMLARVGLKDLIDEQKMKRSTIGINC